MSNGYVYAVINESMPGLVKIGQTSSMNKRLESLYSSSVPTPFECICVEEVDNANEIEARLHNHLKEFRVNGKREFFRVDAGIVENLFGLLPKVTTNQNRLCMTIPDVGKVYADHLSTLHSLMVELQIKGITLPCYQGAVDRRQKKWTLEQTFNIHVPPSYSKVDHWIISRGYEYFPYRPHKETGNTRPVVHHEMKRVYISQQHFAEENKIPTDYVSDKINAGGYYSRNTAQDIIEMYNNESE